MSPTRAHTLSPGSTHNRIASMWHQLLLTLQGIFYLAKYPFVPSQGSEARSNWASAAAGSTIV